MSMPWEEGSLAPPPSVASIIEEQIIEMALAIAEKSGNMTGLQQVVIHPDLFRLFYLEKLDQLRKLDLSKADIIASATATAITLNTPVGPVKVKEGVRRA